MRSPDAEINLLWLCRDEDLDPMRRALTAVDRLHYDHATNFGDMLAPYEFPDGPDSLLDLERYDVIFLDDLGSGYRRFPFGMPRKMRDVVRQGTALIMAGGPESFSGIAGYRGGGQGGYGGTPIEEALPVRIVGDSDVVTGTTRVGPIDARHPIAAGLDWSSFPVIHGYNRVVAKPGATVLARTESGDPFLVVWQYGNARAAAVMTRSARDWGSEFKNWPHYRRFWANLIRWVAEANRGGSD